MTEFPPYNEAEALERSLREIHADWNGLRRLSSRGEKAWLTQMKNHYVRIVQADAEAAAELLAIREHHSNLIRKLRPTSNKTMKKPVD